MDEKDRKIIGILAEQADLSTRAISRRVGLPITTVHNRIAKLKAKGVILNYTINLDHEAIDEGFSAYVLITVNVERLKDEKRTQVHIINDLKRIPEVRSASIVSGGTDIVIFIRTRNVKSFDKLLLERIQMINGISNTQSLIVIH